ncbi:MFS transporter [Psychrobacillus soli]|uniref:MFS transporter n=1 Tax=Psychrobacillus soli TaxID=1543965 RepID=A0A544SWR2_9BACI|nr:MFS transporter [Psychrobacillus soli]TQR09649.1 MFS transporter [Psychrobacillus soli]
MRWIILALLFILYVINFADKSVLGLAAEPIIHDLNLDFEQFGIAGSSFYWFYAVGSILIASLSLRFGTKKLIIFIAAGWTVSLVAAFFVNSLTVLIIIRVILGFFEGGTLALCIAHLAKWFVDGSRGTANAILLSGATFGAYLTAPVLVQLISGIGWRHTFAVLGAASFVWLIIFLFFKEEPKGSKEVVETTATSKTKASFRDLLKVIATPYFFSILLSFFTVMWLIAWVVVWGPTYLTKIVGLTPGQMSLTFMIMGISAAIVSIIVGKFTDNLFKKSKSAFKSYIRVALIALVISATAFFLTTMVSSPVLAILFLTIGITMNNCIAPFTSSVVSSMAHSSQVGSLLGFKTAIGSTAGIIAPLLTGYLVSIAGEDIRAGFNYGVMASVFLYIVSAILLYITSKKVHVVEELSKEGQQNKNFKKRTITSF